ncbi:aspartate aminotransferase family protein [Persicimonas caeni]|uniref:Aspartate aminotransferase family protein n=1 Tax=Persicimonas caeni TaxID=2292766 RepID=A0A4Y6PQN1_PERCE|nr:pyridoxal-dependent decarboxylase [Persicimonas caeni]QDG50409.1 aspartate aminotransferase family protein [Persicimonas caeni]QED31630.1 aspartate aminotransferase family protein [Persicimonas caeni]
MNSDDFRKYAHQLVDWMADYLETVGERRVVPDVEPGEIREQIPGAPPEEAEPFERVFADFQDVIVPGMTHWNHPGWFAYFPANHSPPSILGEMLTATIGAQCMSWQTSPAATELEQVVMGWLSQMLGLPDGFTGVIQDTASTSTLVALLTAREKATGHGFGKSGSAAEGADKLVVYASSEAHSSIAKGVKLAGFGLENLRGVPVDETFAMRPDQLREMIEADLADGLVPACVVSTVGTTSSTAIDPVRAIGEICQKHGVWHHVDAAYAGSAAVLPEKRDILDGMELVDSFVFNPHKWLLTNFDCSAYFVRDVDELLHTCQRQAEYLKTDFDEDAPNFRDWGIPLGRRFRALKLWFVIRTYGVEGLRQMIRAHIDMAQTFRGWVEDDPRFEPLAPSPFGLVCFRYHPPELDASDPSAEAELDRLNEKLLREVNADGRVHLTHTRLAGRYTLRMAIGQWQTTLDDVELAWRLICEKVDLVAGES